MKVLLAFFIKYLLAPILVVAMVIILTNINSIKKKLNIKKLIIFILLSAIAISLPSLFGFLKNEYVWGGLILTITYYLLIGWCYDKIADTKLFSSIGIGHSNGSKVLVLIISMILGCWCYFLLFEWISELPYSSWCMSTVLWVMIPFFISCSQGMFLDIPRPIYKPWELEYGTFDRYYWDKVDSFGAHSVRVRIKRKIEDASYASLLVRMPNGITLGNWFNWFIEDQNKRFPQDTIETQINDARIGWMFYTAKWFKFPIFIRRLDPMLYCKDNKIKNNQTIYVRRVQIEKTNDYNEKD